MKRLVLLVAMVAMLVLPAAQAWSQSNPSNFFLVTEFPIGVPVSVPAECTDTTDPIDVSTCREIEAIPAGLVCDIPVTFVRESGIIKILRIIEESPNEEVVGKGFQCRVPTAPTAAAPTTCPPASQEFSERRIQSGAASPSERISNSGNTANLSPSDQQAVNTGNVANEQGVVQSCGSQADDIDFTGSSIGLSPSLTSTSDQAARQAAAS